MSMLQHFAPFHRGGQSGEIAPFFRFLDDYADHAIRRLAPESQFNTAISWAPKFDIKEKDDAYELQGELPGVESNNIDIEFSDRQHLKISGHTQSESATRSTSADATSEEVANNSNGKQATVEDEGTVETTQPNSDEAAIAKTSPPKTISPHSNGKWVSVERSYGKFSRSFQFPAEIDRDNVKASLKNGILNLYIPKAQSAQAKKVAIASE